VETIDHKPSLWVERARIVAAGGKVCGGRRARLDGNLAVSRSLGDFDFKDNAGRPAAEQKVSCLPDIYEVSGLPERTLLLLACDGLWDAISSEEAAQFVRERLRYDPPMELDEIAQELVSYSLEGKTGDNVTVRPEYCWCSLAVRSPRILGPRIRRHRLFTFLRRGAGQLRFLCLEFAGHAGNLALHSSTHVASTLPWLEIRNLYHQS
ncbi:unnamed protein product, partial [Symbiodinium necroappetens]